jgi:hypothetical protein
VARVDRQSVGLWFFLAKGILTRPPNREVNTSPMTTEYDELLLKIEQATTVITDEGLRRIAFDLLLRHELAGHHGSTKKAVPKIGERTELTRPAKPRSRGSRTASSSDIRERVKSLGISPGEAALPRWSSLRQLDKYLWVLEAAHKKGMEGLTAPEISWLIFEIFRENHRSGQVNNLKTRIRNAQVQKKSFVDGSETLSGWQILKAGKEHLQELASAPAAEK